MDVSALLPLELRARVLALAHGETTPPPLSATQRTCGVSAELANLATLAVPTRHAPPYTVDEENCFARLQLYYRQAAEQQSGAHNLYKLSPLILPPSSSQPSTSEAREASVAAATDMARAEERAKLAETELLELLEREARKAKQSVGGGKMGGSGSKTAAAMRKGRRTEPPPTIPASSLTAEAATGAVDVSLEELSAARGTPLDKADFCAAEWTSVGARPRSGRRVRGGTDDAPPQTIAFAREMEPAEAGAEAMPAATTEPRAAQADATAEEVATTSAEQLPQLRRHEATSSGDGTGELVGELRAQLDSLSATLADREAAHAQELAAERAAHHQALESALRTAQERDFNRLQSLQLRLYIQTSRVATLEGALAKHVATVGKLHTQVDLSPDEAEALALVHQASGSDRPRDESEDLAGAAAQRERPPNPQRRPSAEAQAGMDEAGGGAQRGALAQAVSKASASASG